jgi:hypothetical protein
MAVRSRHRQTPLLPHARNQSKEALMAVSKRLRYEILRRDNHACRYCGATAPGAKLAVDHVIPVALGGTDEPSNLVTSCEPCNSGKSSSTVDAAIVADVQQHQLRWGRAMELAAQAQAGKRDEQEAAWRSFTQSWDTWASVWQPGLKVAPLPDNWKQSVEALRVGGLPEWMWPDIVETAMTTPGVQDHFRYCCGIAWRRVRELQDRELMQSILEGWRELGSVGDAWCEAVRDASSDGIEPEATPQDFKDSLARGLDMGLSIEKLRAAARLAGAQNDGDILAYLSGDEEVQD